MSEYAVDHRRRGGEPMTPYVFHDIKRARLFAEDRVAHEWADALVVLVEETGSPGQTLLAAWDSGTLLPPETRLMDVYALVKSVGAYETPTNSLTSPLAMPKTKPASGDKFMKFPLDPPHTYRQSGNLCFEPGYGPPGYGTKEALDAEIASRPPERCQCSLCALDPDRPYLASGVACALECNVCRQEWDPDWYCDEH